AEGNPLFLEQMVALLIEDGHHNGEGELAVPPTIQALLSARLDRLPPGERAVIEPAAIVGKEFWRSAVVELAPQDAEVSAALQRLVRKEFIRPERSSLPGEDGFRFRHVLIREAAYAGIAKEARSHLHERFANWLERVAPEYEEIVGYHLEQAFRFREELGPLGDGERELGRRAGARLGAAGRRAYGRGDMTAAANLLERAVALLPLDDSLRFEVAPELAWAFENVGRIADAEDLLNDSAERAAAVGRRRDELHARVEAASLHLHHDADGATEEHLAVVREAIPVFEALGDDLGLARAWRLASHEGWVSCRYAMMADALERAQTHARQTGDRPIKEEVEKWLAFSHFSGPTPVAEAIARIQEILAQAEEGTAHSAAMVSFLGGLEAMRGNLARGRELFRKGTNLLEDLGNLTRVGGRSVIAGDIELLAGRPAAAEAVMRRGFEILDQMGERGLLSTVAANLAEAIYRQGRHEEAERFTRVSEEAAAPDDMASQVLWRATRAKVLALRGDLEDAERLSAEGVELSEGTDDLYVQGDTLVSRAEVLALAGRFVEAREAMEEAIRRFEAKGAVAAIPRVRRLMSELHG
ncbi:MAG: adenylate/guanylate cyclase domain-containing protein, partial [Gaiellaceae bacterium]